MNSDDSATSALTALCAAASKARAVGDDNDGDIPTVSTSTGRDSLDGLSRARPALTVDLSKAGRSAPKALSSMSVDFANDDEDGNSSMSDSGFSSTNSNSGSAATGSSTTKSKTGDTIGDDDASSFASAKLHVGEKRHEEEDDGKSKKRTLKKRKKSAHFADFSAKRRKGTASGSSATRPKKGGGKGCSGDDDDELSYAISQLPKPKRPMTAYNYYFQTERKKIVDMGLEAYEAMMAGRPLPDPKERSKERVSFQLIGKAIGRHWKLIPKDDLKRYQALAKDDAKRYERERKIYHAEVASIKAAWAKRGALDGRGGLSASALGRSVVTDSERRSSCSSLRQGAGSDNGTLNSIINSLTKEQINLLLRLPKRQGQDQQQPDPQGKSSLLAPVVERLQFSLPPSSVSAASQSPASASIVTPPSPSEQIENPDVASILLLQSQQISQLQNQISMLTQQQNPQQQQKQQPPASMAFNLPQQEFFPVQQSQNSWQVTGIQQQQQQQQQQAQDLLPFLASVMPQQEQSQQPPPSFPYQNQQQQQLFPLVPVELQGALLNNLNSQASLQQNTNNSTASFPLFGSGSVLSSNGQYAPAAACINSNGEGNADQSFAALFGQLQTSNAAGNGNSSANFYGIHNK